MIAAMTAPIESLRNVPLFANLEDRDLEQLSKQLHERRFAEGNANVSVGGEHRTTLGPGDHFGEIALIDDGVRSASIIAATDLLCYGLTPWEFRPFVEEHPQVAWALMQVLARRYRESQTHEHDH